MQNSPFPGQGESNAPPFQYWPTKKKKPSVACRNIFGALWRAFHILARHCYSCFVCLSFLNHGDGWYRCIAPAADGPMFYNTVPAMRARSSRTSRVSWMFTAKEIIPHIDGIVEWDHSVGGHFKYEDLKMWISG